MDNSALPSKENPIRLIIQMSVVIDSVAAAEQTYRLIGESLMLIDEKIKINGQIIKMLGPCCKEPSK